ncbi:general secretion pathway protein N [Inhella inkyongensis]|uniref:General secretion pathway protein N n=1 Tax=Inhella inkyongensis TaxID=392593 RepID=A0A840S359_9BURK|nr:type II secretion system protein N [Inhella inkyongensis]MBB5203274.1 general secretion pathway protein N [Inhella inkyongensis]
MKRAPVLWGLALGLSAALLAHAPAAWLANQLAQASQGRVLLADSQGSWWQGDARLSLSGGAGSRDLAGLPGRVHWRLGWAQGAPALRMKLDCCSAGELVLRLQLGWGQLGLSLPERNEPLLRLPAALLTGLGTPWNTVQPSGQVLLSAQAAKLQWQQGRWQLDGQLALELRGLSSRLSTLNPLGSYRLAVQGQAGSPASFQLQTLEGALQLQGQGRQGEGFRGEASAAPGAEDALNNLLNIMGRRQGARSLISIG